MSEDTRLILEEIKRLNADVRDIQLTLENETNRNIRLIAERHLDLRQRMKARIKAIA